MENTGGGNFKIKPLPIEAQFAPVYGMITDDFDHDGLLDVLAVGNSYATEVSTGYYDASAGLLLLGDGHGNFKTVTPQVSGFYADHDAKGFARLTGKGGSTLLLIGNNSHAMETYEVTPTQKNITIKRDDVYAHVTTKDGATYKQEFYYGSTYLSQSSRQLHIPDNAVLVEIFDMKGNARKITINPIPQ